MPINQPYYTYCTCINTTEWKNRNLNLILNFYISIMLLKKSMTKGFTLVKEACYEQKGGQREQRYLTDLEIE